MMTDSHDKEQGQKHLKVRVITPSGIYPDDDDWRQVKASDPVAEILEKAAKKLKLTDVSDWVAFVGSQPITIPSSFEQNGLSGEVEIEWHKPEGGGGARGPG